MSSSGVSKNDAGYIRLAIASAKWGSPAADTSIFDFISEVLLTRIAKGQDPVYQNAVTTFAMKFQQFTSPVMAKGLEDTAFYRYNRLVSLNDVGGDLHRFGLTSSEFHSANQERLHSWPHTMLATSTHDSKRSEDVRTRIDALSEMPGLWRLRVREWRRFNCVHRSKVNEKPAPSPNDEYLLYQTLLGAWPLEPLRSENEWQSFRERIENYMLKAMREAKQNTSWINRNGEYETAVSSFVKALLSPDEQNRFLNDFVPFQQRIARIGLWNSLSQILLKLTCPGVPDIYQGNDLWDFSLVDPDNRRPVDYGRRRQVFESIRRLNAEANSVSAAKLLNTPGDGRLKLYMIWKTLCLRKEYPELFRMGDYVPLEVRGAKANHAVAFIRKFENTSLLVVVPRLISGLLNGSDRPPVGPEVWNDALIELPACVCDRAYYNVFTGEALVAQKTETGSAVYVSNALATFPLALCLQS